jgi:hypothetical protein
VEGNDDRCVRPALGQIEVAEESDAVVFGIGNG